MSDEHDVEMTIADLRALLEKHGQCTRAYSAGNSTFTLCTLKVGHEEGHADGAGQWTKDRAKEFDL